MNIFNPFDSNSLDEQEDKQLSFVADLRDYLPANDNNNKIMHQLRNAGVFDDLERFTAESESGAVYIYFDLMKTAFVFLDRLNDYVRRAWLEEQETLNFVRLNLIHNQRLGSGSTAMADLMADLPKYGPLTGQQKALLQQYYMQERADNLTDKLMLRAAWELARQLEIETKKKA